MEQNQIYSGLSLDVLISIRRILIFIAVILTVESSVVRDTLAYVASFLGETAVYLFYSYGRVAGLIFLIAIIAYSIYRATKDSIEIRKGNKRLNL